MKNRKGDDWFPMWVDKWLFGSTRHELLPDEQSVWIDFLSLGAKDEGHIRANEHTPYPISQLAGLLCKTEELIQRTIERCIATGKLALTDKKTLFISNFVNYELSNRHKRRLEGEEKRKEENRIEGVPTSDAMSQKEDILSSNKDNRDAISKESNLSTPKVNEEERELTQQEYIAYKQAEWEEIIKPKPPKPKYSPEELETAKQLHKEMEATRPQREAEAKALAQKKADMIRRLKESVTK